MKTVGDIILDAFPFGCPQYRANPDADDGAGPVVKVAGLEEAELQELFELDDTAQLGAYYATATRTIIEGYRKRWNDAGWSDNLDSFHVLNDPPRFAWALPPGDPVDLFGLCALILELSGAYHHIEGQMVALNVRERARRNVLAISKSLRTKWQEAGADWARPRNFSAAAPTHAPPAVEVEWVRLLEAWDEPVYVAFSREEDFPVWWRQVLALMIIADEAAAGVGQSGLEKVSDTWRQRLADRQIRSATRESIGKGHALAQQDDPRLYTLSSANPDVLCVLPKSRTTQVGCTIRSMSQNLALLPPRGLARANWVYGQAPQTNDEKGKSLNLLLIPYPYRIEAKAFSPQARSLGPDEDHTSGKPFGFFSVSPDGVADEHATQHFSASSGV